MLCRIIPHIGSDQDPPRTDTAGIDSKYALPGRSPLQFAPLSLCFGHFPHRWLSLLRRSVVAALVFADAKRFDGRRSYGRGQELAKVWQRPGGDRTCDYSGAAGQRWVAGKELLPPAA